MQIPIQRKGCTPRRAVLAAIHKRCLGCAGGWKEVEQCEITDCCLWPFRFGLMPEVARKQGRDVGPPGCDPPGAHLTHQTADVCCPQATSAAESGPSSRPSSDRRRAFIRSPLRAIRRECVDCCAGDYRLVNECQSPHDCPLWPFRFGVMPKTAAEEGKLVDPKTFSYWEDMTPDGRRQTYGRDK